MRSPDEKRGPRLLGMITLSPIDWERLGRARQSEPLSPSEQDARLILFLTAAGFAVLFSLVWALG